MIIRLAKSTIKNNFPKSKSMLAGNLFRGDLRVEYVVVGAGGGGGAGYSSAYGGAGGAGGYRSSVAGELSGGGNPAETPLYCPNGGYTVTVGSGVGTGQNGGSSSGANGGNSVFSTVTSLGGGGGSSTTAGGLAKSGGSGGGGCITNYEGAAGTQGQGSQGGGYTDGGGAGYGGGASQPGNHPFYYINGAGITSSITGSAVTYAAGGYYQDAAATANTGNGGNAGYTYSGKDGASGVVIIRFPSTRTLSVGGGLGFTSTTVGSNKVYTFTSGTGTVTFS